MRKNCFHQYEGDAFFSFEFCKNQCISKMGNEKNLQRFNLPLGLYSR